MSSKSGSAVFELSSYRASGRRAVAATKLIDATVQLLSEGSYAAITIGAVAARAAVDPASARRLFRSTDELVIEACLRRIRVVEVSSAGNYGSIARVAAQLSQMMVMVGEQPALASACAAVFLDCGASAERARAQLGDEIRRLIVSAVGPGSWPEVITTLELILSGALIQAAAGNMSFSQAAERVGIAVNLILEGVPN